MGLALPLTSKVARLYRAWLPADASGEDDILLENSNDQSDVFAARMEEVEPAISGILQIRLKMFAERIVSEMLMELRNLADSERKRM
jgi:hypothetical protein